MYIWKFFKSKSIRRRLFFFLMALFLGLVPVFTNLPSARAEGGIDWIQKVATFHNRPGKNHQVLSTLGSDGSIYILGSTDGILDGQTHVGGIDLYIRKFNSDGLEGWAHQFGTTGDDFCLGIAANTTGVYLAGYTKGMFDGQTSAGREDAFIAKYDLDGNPLWIRQFGTSATDAATGVAVTSDGFYVTGYSGGAIDGSTQFGGDDSFVRKYTLDGDLQWSTSFGTSRYDHSRGIAVNEAGVYIAGYSIGANIFIYKFDFSGNEVWNLGFTGEGLGSDDVAAISTYGSLIYLAGYTSRTMTGEANLGSLDVFVKTFDSNGAEIWTRQFGTYGQDSARTLAVDQSGVYVGGVTTAQFPGSVLTGANYDNFVRRYSLEGIEQWTLQFGTQEPEGLTGMAIDSQGIYLSGLTGGSLDDQVGSGEIDAFLKKIDLTSNSLWTIQFNPPAIVSDNEYASAVDANGNVYLAGYINHSVDLSDEPYVSAFLAKYSPEGVQLWMKEYKSEQPVYPTFTDDKAFGVATDTYGNVYLTGTIAGILEGQTSSGLEDVFLIKHDPDGNLIWGRQFGSRWTDEGYRVVVDASGVYVAGNTSGIIDGVTNTWKRDVFVRKYSLDGEVMWTDQFLSSGGHEVRGLAIDNSGLYLGGITTGVLDGQVSAGYYDAYTRKYSLDGNVLWTRQFGTSGLDEINGVDVDNSGVYVTGEIPGILGDQENAGGTDVFVQKYTLDGVLLWSRMFGTVQNDYGRGIAVDQAGIYVVGTTYFPHTPINPPQAFIRKFDLNGEYICSRTFDSQTELGTADGIAVDGGSIYVVGQTQVLEHFSSTDATLIKMSLNENENKAPVVGTISAPAAPVAVNTLVTASASFTDANTSDTHTATWDWGNSTTSAGSITESNGSGTASGAYTYTVPGVYEIKVSVTDQTGLEDNATFQYVVVYDPSAGFVTGGGWIESPAGAYKADESLTGKATFGFMAKYQKGTNIPIGNTAFQFDLAGMAFASQSYEWLVVNQSGSNAQFKGSGLINGAADPNGSAYKFMLWAADGAPDTFRIRIWWEDSAGEHDVYDNGVAQPIGAGNIVVHTSK